MLPIKTSSLPVIPPSFKLIPEEQKYWSANPTGFSDDYLGGSTLKQMLIGIIGKHAEIDKLSASLNITPRTNPTRLPHKSMLFKTEAYQLNGNFYEIQHAKLWLLTFFNFYFSPSNLLKPSEERMTERPYDAFYFLIDLILPACQIETRIMEFKENLTRVYGYQIPVICVGFSCGENNLVSSQEFNNIAAKCGLDGTAIIHPEKIADITLLLTATYQHILNNEEKPSANAALYFAQEPQNPIIFNHALIKKLSETTQFPVPEVCEKLGNFLVTGLLIKILNYKDVYAEKDQYKNDMLELIKLTVTISQLSLLCSVIQKSKSALNQLRGPNMYWQELKAKINLDTQKTSKTWNDLMDEIVKQARKIDPNHINTHLQDLGKTLQEPLEQRIETKLAPAIVDKTAKEEVLSTQNRL